MVDFLGEVRIFWGGRGETGEIWGQGGQDREGIVSLSSVIFVSRTTACVPVEKTCASSIRDAVFE